MNGVQRAAELVAERPGRRKAQRAGDQPPAVLAAAHQQQILLHQARGGQQGRLAVERDETIAGPHAERAPLAPVYQGEAGQQVGGEQFERLGLPRLGAHQRAESRGAFARQDRLLQRQLVGQIGVRLDPARRIERRQADGERRLAGGVGGVEERHRSGGGTPELQKNLPIAAEIRRRQRRAAL